MRKIFFVRGCGLREKKTITIYYTVYFSVSVIDFIPLLIQIYTGVEPVYADDYQLKNRIKAGVNSEEFIKSFFAKVFSCTD